MAVTSGFFNSLNGDRRYTAEQFSALMDGLINNGVFANIGTAFSVKADTGNTVMVGVGRAWFNSAWIYNDAILPVTLNGSEMLLDRIDAVVIEINHTESVRSGAIRIVQGAASSSPQKPTMTSLEGVHQYPLAYIYRTAGSSSINQSNIENAVGTSACPYVTGILQVQSIDNIVAQWESEFNAWMDGLEESLGDDAAVQLANRIISLESQFTTLAKEGRVYADLEDSNSNRILDSEGRVIQGSTAFAYRGRENGSSTVTSSEIMVVIEELFHRFDNFYKVGDVVTTCRNDLDTRWVLCNGEPVERSEYPELSDITPPFPMTGWGTVGPSGSSGIKINLSEICRVKYVNGFWIAVGYYYSNPTSYAAISYTTNPFGTWTRKNLWSVNNAINVALVHDVIYADGNYVVVGENYESSKYASKLAYSSSLSGEWTIISPLGSFSDHIRLHCIAYVNGTYILGGGGYDETSSDNYFAILAYSTSLDTSSWEIKKLWSDAYSSGGRGTTYYENPYVRDMAYADGVLVFVGTSRGKSAPEGNCQLYGGFVRNLDFEQISYKNLNSETGVPYALPFYGMNLRLKYIESRREFFVMGFMSYDSYAIYFNADEVKWYALRAWSDECDRRSYYTNFGASGVYGIVDHGDYQVYLGSYLGYDHPVLCVRYGYDGDPRNTKQTDVYINSISSESITSNQLTYVHGIDIIFDKESGYYLIFYDNSSYLMCGTDKMLLPELAGSDGAYRYIKVKG